MTDEPIDPGPPILALRDALEEAPAPIGMDQAIVQSVERRMMGVWFLELAVVVFGWVVFNHFDFVKSLGRDETHDKNRTETRDEEHDHKKEGDPW